MNMLILVMIRRAGWRTQCVRSSSIQVEDFMKDTFLFKRRETAVQGNAIHGVTEQSFQFGLRNSCVFHGDHLEDLQPGLSNF